MRTPSKRDSRSRQLLKVGMDFIRHNNSGPFKGAAPDLQSPSKDNLLQGNLNYTHSSKDSPLGCKKIVIQGGSTDTKTSSLTDKCDSNSGLRGLSSLAQPQETSTVKAQPSNVHSSCQEQLKAHHNLTESLSSSFESEALDILASLKSSAGLRLQYNRHAKFPTDVDPITGSPRQHAPLTPTETPSISHQMSGRSSRVNSPSVNSNSSAVGSRSQSHTRSPQVIIAIIIVMSDLYLLSVCLRVFVSDLYLLSVCLRVFVSDLYLLSVCLRVFVSDCRLQPVEDRVRVTMTT